MSFFRRRFQFVFVLTALVFGALLLVDPDSQIIENLGWGATTIATVLLVLKSVLGLVLLHATRKALFDYIDMGDIYEKCMKDPNSIGAALFSITVGLFVIAFALIIQKAF